MRSRIDSLWDKDWGECDDLAEAVAQALLESSQICQAAALQVRQEWWSRERALRRDLASIQRLQQAALGSEELRLQALRARALLEETLQRRSEFSYHASLSYWARKGDRMSREFFRTHGQRAAGDQIRSLRTTEDRIITRQEEVMGMATDFYMTLFQQELPAPRTRRCRQEVWRHTPSMLELAQMSTSHVTHRYSVYPML